MLSRWIQSYQAIIFSTKAVQSIWPVTVVTVTASGTVLPAIFFGNLKSIPNEKKVKWPAKVVLKLNDSGSMDDDLMCK